jgi:hypothetical protein
MPYRSLKARMFYAKIPVRRTPVPFCEFRVWIITERPIKFAEKYFDDILNKLEYTFISMRIAREKNTIYYIEGREENVKVDRDEAMMYFARAGVKAEFGKPYRQVHFWHKAGEEVVYNESDIRNIEGTINYRDFSEWLTEGKEEGLFSDDTKGMSMDEYEGSTA